MNKATRPAEVFKEAVDAARNGDGSKLDAIGWECVDYGDGIFYEFNNPSDLQKMAMIDQAKKMLCWSQILIDIATDSDSNEVFSIAEDEVWDFENYFKELQEISTMTDEEILSRGDYLIW